MPSDRRLHPLSFLFAIGAQARSLALPGLFVLLAARSATWQIWLMILLVPYACVAIARYLSYRYRLDLDDLVIRTGILFRNERHIPYARIQNIGSVRNVLHRMLGVADVRIETAGGVDPEARIQVLSVKAMEEMRQRIFVEKRRTGESAAAAKAGEPLSRTLLTLRLADLVVHGLASNRGLIVIAAAAGLAWELDLLDKWDAIEGPVAAAVDPALSGLSVPGYAVLVALGLVAMAAGLRILSIGIAIVTLHGFGLSLAGRELHLSCGLFTRIQASIPLRRIQCLTITERLLHRPFGRAEVKVDTAGSLPTEEERPAVTHQRIAPIIRRERIPALLEAVMPGIDPGRVAWRPVHPRAWRRLAKAYLLITAGAAAPIWGIAGAWGLLSLPVLCAWAVLAAVMMARRMAWALEGDYVLYRSGWLRRRVSMAHHSRIQAVSLGESPFDRRSGMASVRVDTAGAAASTHRIRVPYLADTTARDLQADLSARAAATIFRW